MGYQDSVNNTALTEAYLDEQAKQSLLLYATAAARNADAALSTACREGIVSYQADENTLKVQRDTTLANVSTIGPVHGVGISYTPVVVQGATPTLTNNLSYYFRLGRLVIGAFNVTTTSAGTASNVVTITLPVAMAGSTGTVLGSGFVYDASAVARYDGNALFASSTTVKFAVPNGPTDVYLGSSVFTAALASGDNISGFFLYAAASDA